MSTPNSNPLPVEVRFNRIARLAIPVKMRQRVLEKFKFTCQLCGWKPKIISFIYGLTVHHIIPVCVAPWLAKTESNLMVVCNICHRCKLHHKYKSKIERQKILEKYIEMQKGIISGIKIPQGNKEQGGRK